MKRVAFVCLVLFSAQIHAEIACKCNCDPESITLCASDYDLDHPCPSACETQGQTNMPRGRTACPVVKFYNPDKGAMEWRVICF